MEFITYDREVREKGYSRFTGFSPDSFYADTLNDWIGLEKELIAAVEQRRLTPKQARQVENHYYTNQNQLANISPRPSKRPLFQGVTFPVPPSFTP